MSELRIVLFGMASAGKSSLLGAFAQAGQSQQQALGGQLADPSGGLGELKKLTYDSRLTQTATEIVEYPVTLQSASGGEPIQATIVDCDGRIATDYLSGRRSLGDNALLAKSLREADALVLVLAPTSDTALLDLAFNQFNQFLKLVEQNRGQRSEIAGLPVYLVLTKCDLLAKKDESFSQWVQRIEDGKNKIAKRFKDFLSRTAPTLPFGNIQLHLWATAIRRPAVAENAPKVQEPYGVAELFRQVLDAARAFHKLRTHAHQRLQMIFLGMVAVIAVMGLVALGFYITRPSPELVALEKRIESVLLKPDSPPAERLRDLENKIKLLTEIEKDADFARLSSSLQEKVDLRRQELAAYLDLQKRLKNVPDLLDVKNKDDIKKIDDLLKDIAVPSDYRASWDKSALATEIEKRRSEVQALQKALKDEIEWFKNEENKGNKLLDEPPSPDKRKEWLKLADAFINAKPHQDTDPLPGVPGGTYEVFFEFLPVKNARKAWEAVIQEVIPVRNRVSKLVK